MSAGKKPMTQAETHAAFAFIDSVSKAWLADLVIDLVRRNAGDEMLDGLGLVGAIISEAQPITEVRGDEKAVNAARKSALRGAERDGHNGGAA